MNSNYTICTIWNLQTLVLNGRLYECNGWKTGQTLISLYMHLCKMCIICACFLTVVLAIVGVVCYFVFFNKQKVEPIEDDPQQYFLVSGGNDTWAHPFKDYLIQDLVVNGTCYKMLRQDVCNRQSRLIRILIQVLNCRLHGIRWLICAQQRTSTTTEIKRISTGFQRIVNNNFVMQICTK